MKREERDITKHTLNLYAGDYAKLQGLYPTKMGAAKVIRDIVHAHIRKIEEDAQQNLSPALVRDLGVELGSE